MSLTAKVALLLGAAGMLGIFGWHQAGSWAPDRATFPVQGIDLPAAPGEVEWGSVRAAGADFAYLVATIGTARAPAFEAQWNALPGAGLRRGAVLVWSLCQSGEAQANAFNTTVPRADDALPAAIDLSFREDCAARPEPAALRADIARASTMVEAHTGKPVLLRVSKPFEAQYEITVALRRPVWSTANFLSPGYAARDWQMWRASDMRRIDGIEGPVNWDVVR